MAEINQEDYLLTSHIVKGYSGLDLGDDKHYLLSSRLTPVLTKFKFKDMAELFGALRKSDRNMALVKAVSESLATHESLFFRDIVPFQYLTKTMIPNLCREGGPQRKIRIWSAACSIGQEPYSIVFSIDQARAALGNPSVELCATDFSSFAVERAKKGVYSQFEAQRGLTPSQVDSFFEKLPATSEVQVRERFRKQIEFKELNFLDSFIGLGLFDIIFCRNVLIYFTNPMKKQILERMAQILKPDGYLVLGNTESMHGITEVFDRAENSNCAVYSKKRAPDLTTLRKVV